MNINIEVVLCLFAHDISRKSNSVCFLMTSDGLPSRLSNRLPSLQTAIELLTNKTELQESHVLDGWLQLKQLPILDNLERQIPAPGEDGELEYERLITVPYVGTIPMEVQTTDFAKWVPIEDAQHTLSANHFDILMNSVNER